MLCQELCSQALAALSISVKSLRGLLPRQVARGVELGRVVPEEEEEQIRGRPHGVQESLQR